MPEAIWVVGGEQRGVPHWTKEWKLYKKALVVKVEDRKIQRVLEYQSPPEHSADDMPSIVFKAASIKGNRALTMCITSPWRLTAGCSSR
jgi:hypothetical protein